MTERKMTRVNEIVEYLIEHLVQPMRSRERKVLQQLEAMGYDEEEIQRAVACIQTVMMTGDGTEEGATSSQARRILVDAEICRMETGAHSLLVRLQERGFLSPLEVDRLMDWVAESPDRELTEGELRDMISEMFEEGALLLALDRPDGGRRLV